MYAIKWQNQFATDRIDIESGGDRLWVDGVLGWWQSSLAAGRKTHLCRVRQHIRVYATNAFGQFTNTGATLNTELNNAQRHWNWTENGVKYVCKAVKCNCPGSANWAPSRGQLFCNVHINMATASSDVRKGRLVVVWRQRGVALSSQEGATQTACQQVRSSERYKTRRSQRVCLASHRLHCSLWFGMGCLTAWLHPPPCQPATLRGGSTRTRRSQSTWPQRNSWQHPRACGNWSTFTLSQTTASNAIRAHRSMWSAC